MSKWTSPDRMPDWWWWALSALYAVVVVVEAVVISVNLGGLI